MGTCPVDIERLSLALWSQLSALTAVTTGPCIPRSQTQLSGVKKLGFLYVSRELTCYPFVWSLKSDSFVRVTLRVFVTPVPARTTSILRACFMVAWHGTGPFPLIWIGRGLIDNSFSHWKTAWTWSSSLSWLFSNAGKVCLRPCFFPRFSPKTCMCPLSFRIPKTHVALHSSDLGLLTEAGTDWTVCSGLSLPLAFFSWNQSHWK